MKVFYEKLSQTKQTFFITGCWHWDNILCDRKRLRKDLNEAQKRNAKIIILGDTFDAKIHTDPRWLASDVAKSNRGRSNSIDHSINEFCKFIDPWKHLIHSMGDGNHEYEIHKRYETNMIARVVDKLNANGAKINYGGYFWYDCFGFAYGKNKKARAVLHMLCHHGKGGAGGKTKGVGDIAGFKEAGYIYDTLVFAHKHKSWACKGKWIMPAIHNSHEHTVRCLSTREIQCGTYQKSLHVMPPEDANLAPWAEKMAFAPANMGGSFLVTQISTQRRTKAKNSTQVELKQTVEV